MEIVLFRHGEKLGMGADPELTPQGHNQAKTIVQLVMNKGLPKPTQIHVSPRKRAGQTLEPLARFSALKSKTNQELDQQNANESSREFRLRIQEYLVKLAFDAKNNDVIYICTHHDWAMEFLSVIESDTDLLQATYMRWETAQYMHFQKNELWHLIKHGVAR